MDRGIFTQGANISLPDTKPHNENPAHAGSKQNIAQRCKVTLSTPKFSLKVDHGIRELSFSFAPIFFLHFRGRADVPCSQISRGPFSRPHFERDRGSLKGLRPLASNSRSGSLLLLLFRYFFG